MSPGDMQDAALLRFSGAVVQPVEPARPVDLPTRKTVALLLSTIQGSAALWARFPTSMRSAYVRYMEALRTSCAEHNGAALQTIDASSYTTFATVADAVSAAHALQQTIHTSSWDELGTLPVCVAIHVGSVDAHDDSQHGSLLHQLMRLCATGHPAQILLSAPAQQLVLDELPVQLSLRDLGEYDLAGSAQREHIFQVVAPHLPAAFPPLHVASTPRTNLPAQPTPLIGRDHELVAAVTQLQRADVRLLTLTGPSGIGKTCLALHCAATLLPDFSDGVFLVSLAALSDPAQVLPSIAQVVRATQRPERITLAELAAYLCDKHMLLVLDNFEHVLAVAPLLGSLLERCPGLNMLITSQARLNLYGERTLPVLPLSLADHGTRYQTLSTGQALQSSAVRLFVQRAQMVQPDFTLDEQNAAAIVQLCKHLDGIPLALELAAARVHLLPPQALLARLSDRFMLLAAGSSNLPSRQQTLRNAFDWSYNLLAQEERRLFMHVSVFGDGFSIDAIPIVVAEPFASPNDPLLLETIESLLRKSLLYQVNKDGEPWFIMLETIQAYGRMRLMESGEAEHVSQRCNTICSKLSASRQHLQTRSPLLRLP